MDTDTKLKKRPRTQQAVPSTCLTCGCANGYGSVTRIDTVEFRKETFELDYEQLVCTACGAAILTNGQLRSRIQKTVAAYQERHGLLTAKELIAAREALGFRSRRSFLFEAAELGEATIKRLEAGQRVQDKSTDLAIRSVLKRLEKKQILELLNETMPTAVEATTTIHKVASFPSNWDLTPIAPFAKAACFTAAVTLSVFATSRPTTDGKSQHVATKISQERILC